MPVSLPSQSPCAVTVACFVVQPRHNADPAQPSSTVHRDVCTFMRTNRHSTPAANPPSFVLPTRARLVVARTEV